MATFEEDFADAQAIVDEATGLRRRAPAVNWATAGLPTGPVVSDAEREVQAVGTRFGGRLDTLRGVGRQLAGDAEGAQEMYARVGAREARADAMDSAVSTNFRDWDGVGDVLAGVRKLAIGSAPDMALAVGSGLAARGAARRMVARGERQALTEAPSEALEQAAAARMARQRVQAGTPDVAAAQRREALQGAAGAAVRADPEAMARVARAGRVAGFAGGTAGGMPGLLAEQREAFEENLDQGSAAKLVATAAGAAALDYLPMDRLLGRAFSNPALKQAFAEANPSLMRQLGKRAATAGKRVAGQAGLEGLTEGAQAAVQRAGHKWVDNNVQLLSREALDDYVTNAVGGALLGGTMGAAVDVPQGVAGATADTGRWAWDRTGTAREKIRENLAKPWFRGQQGERPVAGQPMPKTPSSGGAAADLFQQAQDTLRAGVAQGQDALRRAVPRFQELADKARAGAASTFQRAADSLRRNTDLDAQADAVMDGLDAASQADDSGVPIGARKGMGAHFLQKWAVSKVNADYMNGLSDLRADFLGKSLNRLARGETLTIPQRNAVLEATSAGALSSSDWDTIRGVGPALLARTRALSRTAGDELGTLKSPQFGQQDNARAVIDEDDVDAADPDVEEIVGLNEQRGDRELPALDRANSARQGMRAARERGDEAARTEQRDAGRAAFAEAREKLLGGLTTDENRSSTKAAQHYDNRKAQAGFVELADKVDKSDGRGKVMRGQLVNLAMLIKRQQDAMRREGSTDEDIKPRDALLRGLSELAQSGAAINPDTLTKGKIVATYQNKAGEKTRDDEHVMYLSAKDIAAIKGELAKPTKKDVDISPRDPDKAAARLDKDFANATRYETEDNPEPITAAGADLGVLRARETPPGEDMGGGTFTPSNSPVSSVSFNTRHQKDLDEWRKQRRLAGSDQAKLVALNRHFGQKIGAEELRLESEAGTINPARLEAELARLKDPASKLAEKYLKRAVHGKLPGDETIASVRHMPYDKEAPAKGEKNDSWETQVDEGGEYRGEDADLRKRADKNRKTAKRLVKKSHPQAEKHHKKNKTRLTLSKAREIASPEASTGDGLGNERTEQLDKRAKELGHDELRAEIERREGVLRRRREKGLDAERTARLQAEVDYLRKKLGEEAAAKPKSETVAKPKAKKRVVKKADDVQHDTPSVDAAARTAPGKHDHKAEAALANGLMRALGYTLEQAPTLKVWDAARPGGGNYAYAASEINLANDLTGRARIEVLSHEIGHAVVTAEISRMTGVPAKQLRTPNGGGLSGNGMMLALAKANPELFQALKTDYEAWRLQYNKDSSHADMRLSRNGPARGAQIRRAMRKRGVADAAVSATPDAEYQLSMNEWVADNIGRALLQSKAGQSQVEKFFSRLAAQLKRAYDLLFKGKDAAKWAPAPSVKAWVDGMFDAHAAAVKSASGKSVPVASAKQSVAAATRAAAGAPPAPPSTPPSKPANAAPPEGHNDLMEYVRTILPMEARQVLERVFNRPVAVAQIRKMAEAFPDVIDPNSLDAAEIGMEARIAAGFMLWREGAFAPGPNGKSALQGMLDGLLKLANLASSTDYAVRIMEDMQRGLVAKRKADNAKYDFKAYDARSRDGLQKAVNALGDIKEKVLDPLNRAMESNHQRMMESGVPALRAIASRLMKAQEHAGSDRGMLREAVHTAARYATQAAAVFDGMSPIQQRRAMDALQRQIVGKDLDRLTKEGKPYYSPRVKRAVTETRALMDDMYRYLQRAGVKFDAMPNFFPVLLDINNDAAAKKLTDLLLLPKFESSIRELKGFTDEDGNRVPSDAPLKELVQDLVDGARRDPGVAKTGHLAPNFTSANKRSMNFIYKLGTPDEIKTFASLQVKSPAEAFARYIEPMVKRAEYARRFGDDGARLARLLEQAKEQGATDAQLEHAKGAVAAALGTYGQELSPVLNAISPALAKRFSGDKTRAAVDGLQAYQNARLLPLSLLSSLVDPMGVAVRAGGDFSVAWPGIRDGLRTLWNKSSKAQMQDMLQLLGASSDMATHEALNQMFGGAGSKFSGRVNEFVFRWNGMSAWVRATRYMALNAAHGFLLKHADGTATEHSARYLRELGLKPGDVTSETVRSANGTGRVLVKLLSSAERAKASKQELEVDDRVRRALMEFVDTAILRPNSQQTPLWHSDPFMGLVTQYKSFGYAFMNQIAGRVGTEWRNGNSKVALAAASYLPVVVIAEMLRNVLQGDTEDTEEWGPDDWAYLGLQRSGFVTPKMALATDAVEDVERKRLPGTSQIGPTATQARNVTKALEGQRSLSREVESALPGSALYRKWNDEPRSAAVES